MFKTDGLQHATALTDYICHDTYVVEASTDMSIVMRRYSVYRCGHCVYCDYCDNMALQLLLVSVLQLDAVRLQLSLGLHLYLQMCLRCSIYCDYCDTPAAVTRAYGTRSA